MSRAELPVYTVREYQPGDEVSILETFNRVFAQMDPNFVPRTMETWRWLFMDNPSGWRIYLAVTEDGDVMSQYAGIRQRMWLEGAPAHFSQAIDSMTDPAYRAGLKRPGFFVLTGYPYAENYGGPAPDMDTVMWGLPLPQAWRVGKNFLSYELIRTQCKLVAELDRVQLDAAMGVDIEEVTRFPEEVVRLSDLARDEHGAIAVRDKAQLDWRFSDNPNETYAIAVARTAGDLAGYAVYRKGTYDRVETGMCCDWLVPGDNPQVSDTLRAWLLERARADDCERLTAVFPDTCREWMDFQSAGFLVEPTTYFPVGRNYVPKYRMPWLYRNWYYTLGDSDLC
ncbi:MAG: hypothetical protein ACI8TQ_001594 [Planctomycetota bacterium]|jgi:hypothetical protein